MKKVETIDISKIVFGSLAALFISLFIIVLMQLSIFSNSDTPVYNKPVEQVTTSAIDMRNSQLSKMKNFRWVDQEKNIAAVPIDKAKQLVIQEYTK